MTDPNPSTRTNRLQLINGAVSALLIVGAIWWAFSQSVPRPADANDFRQDNGGGRRFGGGNVVFGTRRAPDPVTILPRVVTLRDGELTCSATLRPDQTWNINVTFRGESLGGRESQRLMTALRRALDARRPPVALKLTDDQRAALAAIPMSPPELSADLLGKLTALLNQSQTLAANAPERAGVIQALQALAAEIKGLDQAAATKAYAERDAKVRTILSAEQVATLLEARNNNNNNSNNRGGGNARAADGTTPPAAGAPTVPGTNTSAGTGTGAPRN